jgi:hypothetical protein
MQIEHTRCDASTSFGAAVLSGEISVNSVSQDDQREGGSFDPEAINLLQAVLDEVWACLVPERRADTSRSVVAKRVLELAASGERDRAWLCASVLTGLRRSKDSSGIGFGSSES